jgi:hypothetical protein
VLSSRVDVTAWLMLLKRFHDLMIFMLEEQGGSERDSAHAWSLSQAAASWFLCMLQCPCSFLLTTDGDFVINIFTINYDAVDAGGCCNTLQVVCSCICLIDVIAGRLSYEA